MPNLVFKSAEVPTVFIIDRSASIHDMDHEMTRFIREAVSEKNPDDPFAIVSIGKDAQIERMMSTNANFNSNWLTINTDYTNIEAGLQMASSLLGESGAGRAVLLSDGNETIGNALLQTELMLNQGITVDVVPFYSENVKDVSMETLNVPSFIYESEEAPVSLTINSTEDTDTTLKITLNNETIIQETVVLKEGTNAFTYVIPIPSNGMQTIRAEVMTNNDSILENNQLTTVTTVGNQARVLFVEESVQGHNALFEALDSTDLEIDRITTSMLPRDLNRYLHYDAIIVNNVSSHDITIDKMNLIETAVRDFGVGFIMTGGENSYALGGFRETPIENILPVEMEIKNEEELPSIGMVFVIDRSGSMQGERLELAKEAAMRSVELLREGDTVGVIAFDDQTWPIVETEEMKDTKHVTEQISGITAGGGTDIYPGLAEAYHQLRQHELQRRHIILLTDGQSPETGNYQTLISDGLEENITLSTIAVGQGADHFLLEVLADYGNGRFYSVYDETTIPTILSRETMLSSRTYIEDNPFFPSVVASTDWSSRFNNGVPQMNGYIATSPKSRATTILLSEREDPVLSRWQYGLGRTVAWTSDVEGVWAGDWTLWENWAPLWNDIITWTFPNNIQEPFDITQRRNGAQNTIILKSHENESRPLDAFVVNERGAELDATIRLTAPGEYEVTFNGDEGMHYLQLLDRNEGHLPIFQTGITVAYPDEFRIRTTDESFLERIAEVSGGSVLENGSESFRPLMEQPVSRQNIAPILIIFAFLLLFAEIVVRRFGMSLFRKRISTSNKVEKANDTKSKYLSNLNKSIKRNRHSNRNDLKEIERYESEQTIEKKIKESSNFNGDVEKKSKSNNANDDIENPKQDVKSNTQDRMKRLLEAKNRMRR
nr:VWA domain-containing protein [Bacillus alkalicola]